MKKIFCRLLITLFAVGLVNFSVAHAEVKTYIGVGESIISDRETLETGKQGAKLQAICDAQEQAGVFISSLTEVKNNILQKDEIVAFTAGIVRIEDDKTVYELISQNDHTGTAKYRARVVAIIDTSDLDRQISDWAGRNSREQLNLVNQNKLLLASIEDLKRRNAELEQQLAKGNAAQKNEKVEQNIKTIENSSEYTQKLYDGYQSYYNKDYGNAAKNYGDALRIKDLEVKGTNNYNDFHPDVKNPAFARYASRIGALIVGRRKMLESVNKYIEEYISDRVQSSDISEAVWKDIAKQAVENAKITSENYNVDDGYEVTLRLRDEDVNKIEEFIRKYNK